jgi:hypothetical protein
MITVANQPVGADSLSSGTMNSGKKTNVGVRASFLGGKVVPGRTVGGEYAGTLGGAVGPGHDLPQTTAGTLGGVDKPRRG